MTDDAELHHAEPDSGFADELERELLRRLTSSRRDTSRDRSARPDPESSVVEVIALEPGPRRASRRGLRPALLVAAAAAAVIAIAAVTIRSDESTVSTSARGTDGDSAFVAAIEASDLLSSPSAGDVQQAMDGDLYKPDTGPTEVSAAGNYVSLRTCHQNWRSACSNGWAYITGSVDGSNADVHRGLLGLAGLVSVHLVDDRYFVAVSKGVSNAQAPTAWLIDAVSGKAGPLSWRDEPTTLTSHDQAVLLLCPQSHDWRCSIAQGPDAPDGGSTYTPAVAGLPRVVDARDGTIRPMAMPDDAVPGFPVAQHSAGRVWVGTGPKSGPFGLVYSDDGGASWTTVALPEQLRSSTDSPEIAADGDRLAVTSSWPPDERTVYISDDAGRSWTTANEQARGNGVDVLYVLADGRLVMVWSDDSHATQVLVSTSADWAALKRVDVLSQRGFAYFGVNRAGTAFGTTERPYCPTTCGPGDEVIDITTEFSTDMTHWWTIKGLDH